MRRVRDGEEASLGGFAESHAFTDVGGSAGEADAERWSAGEDRRRLSPLAAALVLPLVVLLVGGGMALRSQLTRPGTPAPNPEARADAAVAYDAAHHEVVLFGGEGPYGVLGDTWTWDGSSWTQRHPAASPSPRAGALMAYDAAHHEVVLVGGRRPGDGLQEAGWDTWVWNGSTWHPMVTGHTVEGLENAAMAYDPATRQLLVVGGGFGLPAGGDQATPTGASVAPGLVHVATPAAASAAPPAAATAAPGMLPLVPEHDVPPLRVWQPGVRTLVWNGFDWDELTLLRAGGGVSQPLWHAASRQLVMVTGSPRVYCTSVAATDGGVRAGPAMVQAGQALPVTSATPAPAVPGQTLPLPIGPRTVLPPTEVPGGCPVFVPAPVSGSCVDCVFQQWSWDGSSWQPQPLDLKAPQTLALQPDPTTGGVVGLTSARTYVAAGRGGDRFTSLPAALHDRHGMAMVADTDHRVVVLFGGRAPNELAADTWTWDGHAWTHVAGPELPPATPFPTPLGNPPAEEGGGSGIGLGHRP